MHGNMKVKLSNILLPTSGQFRRNVKCQHIQDTIKMEEMISLIVLVIVHNLEVFVTYRQSTILYYCENIVC